MCDLTTEVLVDDVVEFLWLKWPEKQKEIEVASGGDSEEYDRLAKRFFSELLCDLAGKCEDLGYYRGGGRKGLDNSIEKKWSEYWSEAGRNIGPDGLGIADVKDAFEAGCRTTV